MKEHDRGWAGFSSVIILWLQCDYELRFQAFHARLEALENDGVDFIEEDDGDDLFEIQDVGEEGILHPSFQNLLLINNKNDAFFFLFFCKDFPSLQKQRNQKLAKDERDSQSHWNRTKRRARKLLKHLQITCMRYKKKSYFISELEFKIMLESFPSCNFRLT